VSGKTNIEWTDMTWNPVRGCSRVSEGCRNCYAERYAARFSRDAFRDGRDHWPAGPFQGFARNTVNGPRWTGKVALIPEKLDEPLRWRKPRRVFVNSMSDLFHESLPFEDIAQVFHVMTGECDYKPSPDHTYQILTKRPRVMLDFFEWLRNYRGDEAYIFALQTLWFHDAPSKRVHLGVSVEDQATADERIPLLLQTPAAMRFVSLEPLLGPVDLRLWRQGHFNGERAIGWIIVGGESGPGARPMDLEWARSAVRQAKEAGVACFVKQLGSHWARNRIVQMSVRGRIVARRMGVGDMKGGSMAVWPEDLRVREFPR